MSAEERGGNENYVVRIGVICTLINRTSHHTLRFTRKMGYVTCTRRETHITTNLTRKDWGARGAGVNRRTTLKLIVH